MNITRSEKLILILLTTNAVAIGGWLNLKFDLFTSKDEFRQYRVAEAYDSSLHVRKVNESFYELQRRDGLTGLVDKNAEYVIYGTNLYVDQIKWDNGIPAAIWSFYSSNGASPTNDSGDSISLANFGNFQMKQETAYERITRQALQDSTGRQPTEFRLPSLQISPKADLQPSPANTNVTEAVQQSSGSDYSADNPETLQQLSGLIPNTDCAIHYCKEGDKRAYPLPTKLLTELVKLSKQDMLPHFEWDSDAPVDLGIIWDPTCPHCKRFYRDVIRDMLREGKNVRFMLSTNEPFDRIPPLKKALITDLLCDAEPRSMLMKQVMQVPYTPQPIPDCDPMPKVKAFKQTLAKYGFDGPTPISFTSTTMLYGSNFKFNDMNRYLQ